MFFYCVSALPTCYTINHYVLENVTHFKNLVVIFDSGLQRLRTTTNKANSVLNSIKRWAKEFKDPHICKRLYTAFVHPILEYSVIVIRHHHQCLTDRTESVQRNFLLFGARILSCYENRIILTRLPLPT